MKLASLSTHPSSLSLLQPRDLFWYSLQMACLHIVAKNPETQAGDHLQLPPVVLSAEGRERGLATSLLERLALARPASVALLSTQVSVLNIVPKVDLMLDATSIDPTH